MRKLTNFEIDMLKDEIAYPVAALIVIACVACLALVFAIGHFFGAGVACLCFFGLCVIAAGVCVYAIKYKAREYIQGLVGVEDDNLSAQKD